MRKSEQEDYQEDSSGRPRLRSNAYGDPRPYPKTNIGVAPGLPQRDAVKPGIVWWCGKKLYLGETYDTQLARLFFLLAEHPGHWHPVHEIQAVALGGHSDPSLGFSDDEYRRGNQRLRKLVSRLTARMQEHGLDDHAIIVAKNSADRGPGYVLLLFQEQKYLPGEAPWPRYRDLEIDGD